MAFRKIRKYDAPRGEKDITRWAADLSNKLNADFLDLQRTTKEMPTEITRLVVVGGTPDSGTGITLKDVKIFKHIADDQNFIKFSALDAKDKLKFGLSDDDNLALTFNERAIRYKLPRDADVQFKTVNVLSTISMNSKEFVNAQRDVKSRNITMYETGQIATDHFKSWFDVNPTGWRATYDGVGDFRFLFIDELIARAFTVDIAQALAGSDILTKSVSLLGENFTLPSVLSPTATLIVQDLEGFPSFRVFENNDWIRLRIVDSSAEHEGYGLVIADVWGTVVFDDTYNEGEFVDGFNSEDGTQAWNFTVDYTITNTLFVGLKVFKGSIVLDYGQSGDSYIERSVLNRGPSNNSYDYTPYDRIVKWEGPNPKDGTKTTLTHLGNLKPVTGVKEFGAFFDQKLFVGDITEQGNFLKYDQNSLEARMNKLMLDAVTDQHGGLHIDSVGRFMRMYRSTGIHRDRILAIGPDETAPTVTLKSATNWGLNWSNETTNYNREKIFNVLHKKHAAEFHIFKTGGTTGVAFRAAIYARRSGEDWEHLGTSPSPVEETKLVVFSADFDEWRLIVTALTELEPFNLSVTSVTNHYNQTIVVNDQGLSTRVTPDLIIPITGFTEGVISSAIESPQWDTIEGKPFTTIGSGLEVISEQLRHIVGFSDKPTDELTGAFVISRVLVSSHGHVTGVNTRELERANLVVGTGVALTGTPLTNRLIGSGNITVATIPATASVAGHVSTAAQEFGGQKTFKGKAIFEESVNAHKDIEWIGSHANRFLKNTGFIAGFDLQGGAGIFFGRENGGWNAYVDNLLVRKALRASEFIVDQTRAIMGTEIMSAAVGKIEKVQHISGDDYEILLEDPDDKGLNPFTGSSGTPGANDDRVIIQQVVQGLRNNPTNPDGGVIVKHIKGRVFFYQNTNTWTDDPMGFRINISPDDETSVGAPEPGDSIVLAFNPGVSARQNIIVRSVTTSNGALVYTKKDINTWAKFFAANLPSNNEIGVAYNGVGDFKLYRNASNLLRFTDSEFKLHVSDEFDIKSVLGDFNVELRNTADRQGLYVYEDDADFVKSVLSVGRIYELDVTAVPSSVLIATARRGIAYYEAEHDENRRLFELSDTVKQIGGINFIRTGLHTGSSPNFAGVQAHQAASTRIFFAGATSNVGANANFWVQSDGAFYHPSVIIPAVINTKIADEALNSTVSAELLWTHEGPTLGTKSTTFYIHRLGVSKMIMKHQRVLTVAGDSGRVRLSIRPQAGGSAVLSEDDDFDSTSWGNGTIEIDVSSLTANTVYMITVAIGAWFGPSDPQGQIHVRNPIIYATAGDA